MNRGIDNAARARARAQRTSVIRCHEIRRSLPGVGSLRTHSLARPSAFASPPAAATGDAPPSLPAAAAAVTAAVAAPPPLPGAAAAAAADAAASSAADGGGGAAVAAAGDAPPSLPGAAAAVAAADASASSAATAGAAAAAAREARQAETAAGTCLVGGELGLLLSKYPYPPDSSSISLHDKSDETNALCSNVQRLPGSSY